MEDVKEKVYLHAIVIFALTFRFSSHEEVRHRASLRSLSIPSLLQYVPVQTGIIDLKRRSNT